MPNSISILRIYSCASTPRYRFPSQYCVRAVLQDPTRISNSSDFKSKSVCLTANRTNLLHSGCLTTNVKVLGTTIKNATIFVAKDLNRTNCILGMNVLKHLPMFADCVKVTSKKKRRKRKVKGDQTSKKSFRRNHNKFQSSNSENNRRRDQSRTDQHTQRLFVGDKVFFFF